MGPHPWCAPGPPRHLHRQPGVHPLLRAAHGLHPSIGVLLQTPHVNSARMAAGTPSLLGGAIFAATLPVCEILRCALNDTFRKDFATQRIAMKSCYVRLTFCFVVA